MRHIMEMKQPCLLFKMLLYVLPKCATSILQPLDMGIIASTKKMYQFKLSERAVLLIDDGISEDLYKNDIKQAIL